MSMILEYPFKIFILIVVVLVIISIMWQFRDKITSICLFPPCEDETECNVQPVIQDKESFTEEELDYYCNLCWIKNGAGTCNQNSVCYIFNLEDDINPGDWEDVHEIDYNGDSFLCVIKCEDETSSFYVQYQSLGKIIEITC